MNTVPLILILILAVCSSSQGASPCTASSPQSQYYDFVQKHILQSKFNRNSLPAWQSYLQKHGLWCREPTQSFLETSQNDICTTNGSRVFNGGNFCMSRDSRLVYDVKTYFNPCRITVTPRQTPVVVACNKVNNICLPVHYERYNGQTPSNLPCPQSNPYLDL